MGRQSSLANFLSHVEAMESLWVGMGYNWTRKARREILQLDDRVPTIGDWLARRAAGVPILNAWSPSILPQASDQPLPDYFVTGSWNTPLSTSFQPPKDIADFLAAGSPPICIGFGSMTPTDPERQFALLINAALELGERVVVLSGWSKTGSFPASDRTLFAKECPHDWLFPKVKAVVHHGGAGTTAAALRSGRPSWIVPHSISDQPFWGRRVHQLGCGPAPVDHKSLSAENVRSSLRELVSNSAFVANSERLQGLLQAENITNAVSFIFEHLKARKAAPAPPSTMGNIFQLDGTKPAADAVWELIKHLASKQMHTAVVSYWKYSFSSLGYTSPADVTSLAVAALSAIDSSFTEPWEQLTECHVALAAEIAKR